MPRKSYNSDELDQDMNKKKTWRDRLPTFERPETMTGAQLQEKFDGWRASTTEKIAARTPEQNSRVGRRSLCVVLGLALVGMALFTSTTSTSFESTKADQTHQIQGLQKRLAGPGEDEKTAPEVTSESMLDLNTKAVKAADDVAAGQNTFAALAEKANDSVTSKKGNGAPTKEVTALFDHRKEMAKFWDKGSWVVTDDKEAYEFTTAPVYNEESQIDPRFPWYIRYDGFVATKASEYSWTVTSAMPSLEKPTQAGVIWECKDKDGTVLSWASATYDGASGTFHDLDLVVTAEGLSHSQDVGTGVEPARVPELNKDDNKDKG